MARVAVAIFVFMALAVAGLSTEQGEASAANPIRKVVTMLQMMVSKVKAEGEKEAELYEKYVCWCKSGGSSLGKSISDAGIKVPELQSDIEASESHKAQLEEDVKQHQADRDAAKASIKEATAIRTKEAEAYAAESAETKANVDAIELAVAAISADMTGGFLQTGTAQAVRKLTLEHQNDLQEADREALAAFLAVPWGAGYVPQSGQIVGILKQLGDEMAEDFAEAKATEEAAIKAYAALMAAKKKEIAASTKAIEEKLTLIGELGVKIAEMKNDLTDTEEALVADKKFLADLEGACAKKKAEWEERSATRTQELAALADTIKVLNDDDALELFKKTLPSASASFLQFQVSARATRSRALAMIRATRSTIKADRPRLDFIALALRGKKIGFAKVIAMIDAMVQTLKEEQAEDDKKQEYCAVQFDQSDDKKKALERSVSDLETAIANTEESISTLAEEIAALNTGIAALDKSVAEATEQRKAENEDFTELMAQDSAAKEVINFAKNRLMKFYNPALYKPPAKREVTEAERITLSMGGTLAPTAPPAGIAGTGIETAFLQLSADKEAPPPPPETFGAYAKKSETTNGVVAMIDLLLKDLEKEMTEATAEEKDAQGDYEEFISGSAAKRAEDSKALTDKTAREGQPGGRAGGAEGCQSLHGPGAQSHPR